MVKQSDFVVVFIQNVQVYVQIKCYQGKNGVTLFTYDHYMHSDIKECGWMPNETKNDAVQNLTGMIMVRCSKQKLLQFPFTKK